jgi:hypothetical protein
MNKFFLILAICSCNTYSLPHLGVSPGKALVATSVYKTLNNDSKEEKEEKEQLKKEKEEQQLPAKQKDCASLDGWLTSVLLALLVLVIIYIIHDISFRYSSNNRTPGKYSMMLHYTCLPLELPHTVRGAFSFFLDHDNDLVIHDSCIYHSKSKTIRKLKDGSSLTVFLSKSEKVVITKIQKDKHQIQNLTKGNLYYTREDLIDLSIMAPSDYNNQDLRI